MGYCMVITTCSKKDEARYLAAKIIEEKLAACVQISSIESFYTWEGKTENEPEQRLLIKTRNELYDRLEQLIRKNHSYDLPQIIQIPIQDGFEEYLDWVDEATNTSENP
ncbi:MAG: divalent-cation tolerance protein CutA [Desulfobacteraceae bacterium]|nr:divalent-cation tolerance protein CutA [Desulfobacteraceae bacterium]